MQGTDGIRRNGYVVALVLGLIAMFVMMTGSGWTATVLVLAAMAVIGVVEHIAERQQRGRRPAASRDDVRDADAGRHGAA
jgi:predicted lipid-binding transport protein (Tim44 family)